MTHGHEQLKYGTPPDKPSVQCHLVLFLLVSSTAVKTVDIGRNTLKKTHDSSIFISYADPQPKPIILHRDCAMVPRCTLPQLKHEETQFQISQRRHLMNFLDSRNHKQARTGPAQTCWPLLPMNNREEVLRSTRLCPCLLSMVCVCMLRGRPTGMGLR